MKGKIKILSLLLAAAMVASMFVACKSDEPTAPSSTTTPSSTGDASTPDAEPVKKDPVKLKWYQWGDNPKKPDAVVKALNEKSMADIGVEMDFIWATGDDQKVKTMMATGGEFDITFTCAWYANYVVAAQNGQLADITDKVKTVTPKLYDYIPEVVWEGSKVNGKIYAVPTYKDTAAAQYWSVNKEYVIDGAGAEAELKATGKTAATVTPLLEKVKAYNDAGTKYPNNCAAPFNYNWAGLNGYGTGWDSLGLAIRAGVKIDSGNTTVVPMWEDADMIAEFKTLKGWMDNGLVNKNALTTEKEPEFIVVGSGQGWDGCEAIWGNSKPYTVAINKKYGPIYTTDAIQGSMNGISPNSKNIDRALEYLEYANTDKDYRNMLAYGIKDVNWKLTAEGSAEKITQDDWSPGLFAQASFFEMVPMAPAPADMYTNLKAVNDSADPSPLVGFVPNTDSIKNEITAANVIIEKFYKQLQTGDNKDVDATCQQAMKELRSAGYDKIIKELQTQVDAFMASK